MNLNESNAKVYNLGNSHYRLEWIFNYQKWEREIYCSEFIPLQDLVNIANKDFKRWKSYIQQS